MKKGFWISGLLLFSVILAGCFALTEPEESSGAVVAPTLAPAAEVAPAEPTDEPVPEETAVPVPEESTAVSPAEPGGVIIYEIDAGRSEARFTIEEVLRG